MEAVKLPTIIQSSWLQCVIIHGALLKVSRVEYFLFEMNPRGAGWSLRKYNFYIIGCLREGKPCSPILITWKSPFACVHCRHTFARSTSSVADVVNASAAAAPRSLFPTLCSPRRRSVSLRVSHSKCQCSHSQRALFLQWQQCSPMQCTNNPIQCFFLYACFPSISTSSSSCQPLSILIRTFIFGLARDVVCF